MKGWRHQRAGSIAIALRTRHWHPSDRLNNLTLTVPWWKRHYILIYKYWKYRIYFVQAASETFLIKRGQCVLLKLKKDAWSSKLKKDLRLTVRQVWIRHNQFVGFRVFVRKFNMKKKLYIWISFREYRNFRKNPQFHYDIRKYKRKIYKWSFWIRKLELQ